ncbi:hypothetical protein [Paenibacillus sp. IHBB 10380]|uniref:hypothetical protein n=1 Tax=Paenibacillus sp. IHBB 10380 TaxID=1566358 RepID=UPI0005CFAF43|nr:hypothetical protein [Paenibacillus sp. IHBB 10380]AJS59230.1 hypothetical protein UB51_12995 [Paenibacillus sp. IHBB 10380]
MHRGEVAALLIAIKKNYSWFDTSDENIDFHLKKLHDFPYPVALKNVEVHILTNDFPPIISQIRGKLPEQQEYDRLKAETQTHLAKLELWEKAACPPPAGMREALHAKLSRTRED